MRFIQRAVTTLLFLSSHAISAAPASSKSGVTEVGTVFNGVHVPPLTELSGETLNQDIAKGYWLVDAFSPYCPHCTALAPKFQKVYEYYYTSIPDSNSPDPIDPNISPNSFTNSYDFRFAKLDCVAFGTACEQLKIMQYPTLTVFKDGVNISTTTGDQSIKSLSGFIEKELEKIKPGTRPEGDLELPRVKDKRTKDYTPGRYVDLQERSAKGAENTNPKGKSVPLTADSFQKQVTRTLDPWFVKFYAPWCQHCQHMARNWDAMAREMRGKLNIGEVNCDMERRLCHDVHADSYPTLMYFQGGEKIEYEGGRMLGDFISFANQAYEASSGVREVDFAQFEQLEKTEEVLFLYLYDHAAVSEDMMALERLPVHLIGHAKLVKSQDVKLAKRFKIHSWPRLVVIRSGRMTQFEHLAPDAMRDVPKVIKWMQSVWLPIVPELTAANANEIMTGKYVVLGVLSPKRTAEFAVAKREIKNAALEWMDKQDLAYKLERQELRDAKQLRIEEAEDRDDDRALRDAKQIHIDMNDLQRKDVVFAWADGVFWERWIRTSFGISVGHDGEKVIVFDHDNRRYWDQTITTNPIVPSRTSILETLPKIVANPPKLKSKPIGSTPLYYLHHIGKAVRNHGIISLLAILASLGALVVYSRRGRQRGSRGLLRGDGKDGSGSGSGAGVGLLGFSTGSSQANGKVD